jgi:putative AlgH/UPF0301 family transcriptional regulator
VTQLERELTAPNWYNLKCTVNSIIIKNLITKWAKGWGHGSSGIVPA